MDEVQKKISDIVEDYKKLCPQEYEDLKTVVRQSNADKLNRFSEIKGNDYVNRALFEISETLDNMFNKTLTKDENMYRKTKECARWFANKYKEFSVTVV